MKKNNENKSIISTLFTEKELAELNFTPEEIEEIEYAEAFSKMVDTMPTTDKEMDAFFAKFDAFMDEPDPVAIIKKFLELPQKDLKFFNQIMAMKLILDEVEEVPEAKTEKVSLDDINKEKVAQEVAARKAKFAAIDEALKNMK